LSATDTVLGWQNGRRMEWLSAQFDGHLQVLDGGKFTDTVASGIGSAKSFGFGLLSLAPAGSAALP
jgi:CRISPR system Cascade subunit CasE